MTGTVNPFAQPAAAATTQPFQPAANSQPITDAQAIEAQATVVTEPAQAVAATPVQEVAAAQPAAAQPAATPAAAQPAQVFATPAQTAVATQANFPAPAAAQVPVVDVPLAGTTEVSFDSDIKFNKLDKFAKMKKDEVARIAFLLADANNQPRLRMSHVFYDDATKRSYLAPEDKAIYAKFMEKFGEPKIRFATIVAVYHTDLQGNPLSQSIRLQAFVFGQDKFPDLKQLHKNWNLLSRDLMIQCKEEAFQKMTYSPTPDSWLGALPQLLSEKRAEALELFGKPLDFFLGRKLNQNEIAALLGMAGAPMQGGAPAYNPFGAPAAGQPAPAAGGSPFAAAPVASGAGAAPGAGAFADLVVNGTNQA